MTYEITISAAGFSTKRDSIVSLMTQGLVAHYADLPTPTEAMDEVIISRTKHDISLKYFKDEFGEAEGIKKFKVAWYQAPSPFHDKISMIMYSEKYMAICCDKARAVRTFIESNTTEVINQYILDHSNPTIEVDSIVVTIA